MPNDRAIVIAGGVTGRRSLSSTATNLGYDVVAASPDLRTSLARVQQHTPGTVVVDGDVALDTLADLRRLHGGHLLVLVGTDGARAELVRAVGGTPMTEIGELPPRGRGSAQATNTPARPAVVAPTSGRRPYTGPIELLAVGASTGGPAALATLLKGLPASLPVPVLLTQHMPANFTKVLASRLDAATGLRVREAQGGERLEPGDVWIAPGDRHLVIARDGDRLVTRLNSDPPECFCRPSVDVMFRSIAEVLGGACLAVVLTGMGQDGLRGATALNAAGATVFTQDEATSVVWGMPGYVTRAGLATRVLPIDQIATEILGRVVVGRNTAALSMRRELGRAS